MKTYSTKYRIYIVAISTETTLYSISSTIVSIETLLMCIDRNSVRTDTDAHNIISYTSKPALTMHNINSAAVSTHTLRIISTL